MTRDWTKMTCLAVSHSNHYTKMFSVLVWGSNWILFMHGWFCPIRLIHVIGRKSLHFEKRTCLLHLKYLNFYKIYIDLSSNINYDKQNLTLSVGYTCEGHPPNWKAAGSGLGEWNPQVLVERQRGRKRCERWTRGGHVVSWSRGQTELQSR